MRKPGVSITQAVIDRICEEIAGGGTLREILQAEDMPNWETVRRALLKDEEFREQYERARIDQADYFADQMLEYAAKAIENPKAAHGYRVAADILRWQAMVRSPRKYSDRLIQENQVTQPLDPKQFDAEIKRLYKELGFKVEA